MHTFALTQIQRCV